jgi:hypothetical protein
MAEHYYTDKMRELTASLDNIHNFPITIMQLEDSSGPFLSVSFSDTDYTKYGQDKHALFEIASYLVDLRNGLIDLGARVTFAVTAGDYNAKVG